MTVARQRRDPTRIGTFSILGRIGSGGVGSVYKAQHRDTGDFVAIKMLTSIYSENPKQHQRFVQEFQATAKLDHPNIVRSIEQGLHEERIYLVMEYVEGCDLATFIEKNGAIDEPDALRAITHIAQALDYAHSRRIVHRDVKPDNILIRGDGLVKLADFGLAKDYNNDQDFTRPMSGLGTVHYMAPEQFEDAKHAGVACDIYSLGATLYALLTAQVPFSGVPPLAALTKKLKGDLPPVHYFLPSVTEGVERAILAAMDPEPANRPASCLEWIGMLTEKQSSASMTHTEYPRGTECRVNPFALPGGESDPDIWPAMITALSMTHVEVMLARRFERGTELLVNPGPIGNTASNPLREVIVERIRGENAGHWSHHCRFVTPFTEADFRG